METKKIGAILIAIAIAFIGITYMFKLQEDKYIEQMSMGEGGCFINGKCLYEERTFTIYIIAGALSVLALFLGLYLTFFERKGMGKNAESHNHKEYKEVDIFQLDDEEKQIYKFIKEHKGSAFQSDLVREFGFPKAKVTRILDRLEDGGILERKRRGMTNIIMLK